MSKEFYVDVDWNRHSWKSNYDMEHLKWILLYEIILLIVKIVKSCLEVLIF